MPNLMTRKKWKNIGVNNNEIEVALAEVYKPTTLHERLDCLISLYEACAKHQPRDDKVLHLQETTAEFIRIIANTTNDNLDEAIKQRKSFRELWPSFLPNTQLRHLRPLRLGQSLATRMTIASKHTSQLILLDKLQRENYRVLPAKGSLWQLKQPEDDNSELKLILFDTAEQPNHEERQDRATFYLNPHGELFAGSFELECIDQASFHSEDFFSYRGTIEVSSGQLKYIGSYENSPSAQGDQFFNMIKEFSARGLINRKTIIDANFSSPSEQDLFASTYRAKQSFLALANKTRSSVDDIDHYQVLKKYLEAQFADKTVPSWYTFTIVMQEYLSSLSLGSKKASQNLAELKIRAARLGLTEGFARQNPESYNEHLGKLNDLIAATPLLKVALGGLDWLPKPKQLTTLKQ